MIFYSIFLFGLNLVLINAFPAKEISDVQEDTNHVRFYCINSSDKQYKLTRINDKVLTKNVDLTKDFAFYVHGWLSRFNFDKEGTTNFKIGKAWVKAKDTNFCGVDWSGLAKDGYYDASQKHVKYVGTQIALFLKGLYARKVKMDSISIAGHSLGAHVAGYAGKLTHEWTKKKISTIFGLDPAGPLFTAMPISDFKLTKDNANFVQVLHTSSGSLGTSSMLGHADFIANDGFIQEKCVKNVSNADDLSKINNESRNSKDDINLSIRPSKIIKCSHSFANEIFLSSFMNKCVGVSGIKEEKSVPSTVFSKVKGFFFGEKKGGTEATDEVEPKDATEDNKISGIKEEKSLFSKIKGFFFGGKKGETEAKDVAEAEDTTEDNEITPDAYGIKNHGISGVFKLRTTKSKPYCVKA